MYVGKEKPKNIFIAFYKAHMKVKIENVLKGLVAGILSMYCVIYALRPAAPYPEIILEIFENPFMFLILLIINYYVFVWDHHSGAILLLCIIALVFDYVVFTHKGFNRDTKTENFTNDVKADMLKIIENIPNVKTYPL